MRFIALLLLVLLAATGTAADPRAKSGPVEVSSLEELKAKAAELGRPAAILYQDTVSTCPLHNGQCARWIENPALNNFVILKVDWKAKNDGIAAINRLRDASNDKAGNMIPMLFLVDDALAYKDVIPYKQDEAVTSKALLKQVEEYGVVLPASDVATIEREILRVAPFLAEGKTDNARTALKKIKPLAAQSPKAGFAKSYATAETAFNQHVIATCEALLKTMLGKSVDERTQKVTTILRKYKDLLSDATNTAVTELAKKTE